MIFTRKVVRNRLVTEVTDDDGRPLEFPGQTDIGLYVNGPGPDPVYDAQGNLDMTDVEIRAWFEASEVEILRLIAEGTSAPQLGDAATGFTEEKNL